ncbi:MAG TPA: glycosyltransferase family 2 protein [Candidatus Binatia bacterium]|jgi:glycosyltransferase involved in cell wall biosynthesis|nr:glycosyltransferase family 2 protein [Candidatus Binatia bacterium]
MASHCTISIIIPVFNEAEILAVLLGNVQALNLAHAEVIVVDDGSTDASAEIALSVGVNVIRHPYNIGNGAAVKSGIRAARGKFIVLMDGDGQHKPEDIPKLLAEASNYHMVVGARAKGSKLRFHRYAANLLYNLLASYVTKFKVQDLTSGFRVLTRREALRFIDLLPNTFSYPTTLTLAFLRSGFTVKYVPIQTLYRAGQSKISLITDGIRFLLIITKIATLFSPFRIFLPVSIFFFLAGASNYFYTYITERRFTNMSVFMFTTAVIIFMLGLISEQIALLRMERQRSREDGLLPKDD